jgi:hypothetical protein
MVLKRSYGTDPENEVDKGKNPFLEFNVADVGDGFKFVEDVVADSCFGYSSQAYF